MLNFFKKLFGGTPEKVETEVVTTPATKPAPIPVPPAARKMRKRHAPRKRSITKSDVNARKYYKRGGSFYSVDDDSIIDDLLLLTVLAELYDEGSIDSHDESHVAVDIWWEEREEPAKDLLDVDVSDTPVVEAPPVSTYTAPEPVKQESYSSGSSYASGSSDYDSGGSDSGGSSDD